MARDKAKDDNEFNCSQQHEHDYVIGLYNDDDQDDVEKLLEDGCKDNTIYHSTHMEVYELINEKLRLPIPEADE